MATNLKAKDAFYAVVGVGDAALERARNVAGDVRSFADKNRTPRTFVKSGVTDLREFVSGRAGTLQKRITKRQRNVTKAYNQLAKRGQSLVSRIRRSAPAKRAAEQTRTATRQVRSAAKSVRKAASSTAEATVSAAQKVG